MMIGWLKLGCWSHPKKTKCLTLPWKMPQKMEVDRIKSPHGVLVWKVSTRYFQYKLKMNWPILKYFERTLVLFSLEIGRYKTEKQNLRKTFSLEKQNLLIWVRNEKISEKIRKNWFFGDFRMKIFVLLKFLKNDVNYNT